MGWIALIVILAVIIIFIGWIIAIYNTLVRLRNAVKNAFSQIDVQLKRRYDLIPNLVETVKGYAAHERETLEAVTKARQQAIDVSGLDSVKERARVENILTQNLKANENFLKLQEELTTTENKISFARQFYNDSVMQLNNKTEMFPSNIIAGMFSFKQAEFFEVEEEAERKAPEVKF
jgi:LemA protein